MRLFAFLLMAACGTHHTLTDTDKIAQCLTDKGMIMYGAFWCPHCAKEKEWFGDAFQYVHYVECSNPDRTQNDTCNAASIKGYPTFEFADSSRLEGEKTVAELAAKAGCDM